MKICKSGLLFEWVSTCTLKRKNKDSSKSGKYGAYILNSLCWNTIITYYLTFWTHSVGTPSSLITLHSELTLLEHHHHLLAYILNSLSWNTIITYYLTFWTHTVGTPSSPISLHSKLTLLEHHHHLLPYILNSLCWNTIITYYLTF